MAEESQKENVAVTAKGCMFEVVLKPATAELGERVVTPLKELAISREDIERKLQDAETRRQSIGQEKIAFVAKDMERRAEAQQKVQKFNESFSMKAKEKLEDRMETFEQNRNAQISQLRQRVLQHLTRVEEVRKANEAELANLRQRIEKKMEENVGKREAYIKGIQERIRAHDRHVLEVQEIQTKLDSKFSEESKEKLMQRMEVAMRNYEQHMNELKSRMEEQEAKRAEVRQKKLKTGCDGDFEQVA